MQDKCIMESQVTHWGFCTMAAYILQPLNKNKQNPITLSLIGGTQFPIYIVNMPQIRTLCQENHSQEF